MAGYGFRLNPYEQDVMGALQTGLQSKMDPQTALAILQATIGGAQQRKAENQAQMQGLRDQALQLYAGGMPMETVSNATSYGLGPKKAAGMMDYVQGLYTQPMGQIDDADKQMIGQTVVGSLQQGVPFVDIREQVRQLAVASGYDPAQVENSVKLAEDMYQQATGVPLSDMRYVGNTLRGTEDLGALAKENPAVNSLFTSAGIDPGQEGIDIQGMLGQLMATSQGQGTIGQLGSQKSWTGGPNVQDQGSSPMTFPTDVSSTGIMQYVMRQLIEAASRRAG